MASTRRAPLSTLPNGGNSPFRGMVPSNSLKRTRAHADPDALAASALQQLTQPPSKKHIVEANAAPVTPRKHTRAGDEANFTTPIQRKHATRTREPARAVPANPPAPAKQDSYGESIERLRVWQRHNEKAFPSYVFYFESVSDLVRRECAKDLKTLGAREAQFFSREVTHVVTTRSLPADDRDGTAYGETATVPVAQGIQEKPRLKTINPSLLEKTSNNLANPSKGKFTFEAPMARKMNTPGLDVENRRPQPVDMLQKAKEMGIKIWHLDKLRRILDVMFDDGISANASKTRAKVANVLPKPQPTHQDLQALIRNEEIHGPNEQEIKLLNDVIPLRGPYIYIRCVNEKVKPIMVRQWAAVEIKEDGEWPQFRSVSPGKCPFVPEESRPRRLDEETQAIREEKSGRAAKERQQQRDDLGQQLRDKISKARNPSIDDTATGKQSGSEPLPPAQAKDRDFKAPFPQHTSHTQPGAHGGEPMASGLQASNVTSAIRSQMISSTAAAPGVKAGTSREIHGLQRKVLERGSTSSARNPSQTASAQYQNQQGLHTSTRANAVPGLAGAAEEPHLGTQSRLAKLKAQEKLGQPVRGQTDFEEDATSRPTSREARPISVTADRQRAAPPKPVVKKEAKPGYCENCREKFDDFDEHVVSKRHRKFAVARENWKDLDNLLAVLGRPLLDHRDAL